MIEELSKNIYVHGFFLEISMMFALIGYHFSSVLDFSR